MGCRTRGQAGPGQGRNRENACVKEPHHVYKSFGKHRVLSLTGGDVLLKSSEPAELECEGVRGVMPMGNW